jgi:hypothetical protein
MESLDNADLVLGWSTDEEIALFNCFLDMLMVRVVNLSSHDCTAVLLIDKSKHGANSESSILVLTSDHDNVDTSPRGFSNGIDTLWTRRIHDGTQANHCQPWAVTVSDKRRVEFSPSLDRVLGGSLLEAKDTPRKRGNTRNHVRGTLNVDNKAVVLSRFVVFFVRLVHGRGSHELVFRAEWGFLCQDGSESHSS